MNISGSTITIVGKFSPVAIQEDIENRGGNAETSLTDTTKYLLVGFQYSDSDRTIVTDAQKRGIPIITLAEYKQSMPDELASE